MRMDRVTNRLMQALQDAQSLALSLDHNEMSPWHLLKALLMQNDGSARSLVLSAGGQFDQLLSEVERALEGLARVANHDGEIRMSQDLARQVNLAEKQSMAQKDAYLSSETVLAVMSKDKATKGVFQAASVNEDHFADAIEKLRGGESVQTENDEDNRGALEKYCLDLTARASDGKLDPVIGRDEEIRRAVQVLQRRTKNNPVLIGEPGVGKTALARRFVLGEAPDQLGVSCSHTMEYHATLPWRSMEELGFEDEEAAWCCCLPALCSCYCCKHC